MSSNDEKEQHQQETKRISLNLYIIGSKKVGKKSFVSRLKSIMTKANPTNLEIVPEGDIILYTPNLTLSYMTCICDECHLIRFNDEISNEDEDFEIERKSRKSFKPTHKSVIDFITNHKNPINSNTEHIFIFMYDITNYSTFEDMIYYYESLRRKFHFEENKFTTIVLANKNDRQAFCTRNEQNEVTNFALRNPDIKQYEISTKINFNFKQFVSQLFEFCLVKKDIPIQQGSIYGLLNFKQSFNKSARNALEVESTTPGVGTYNLDQYVFQNKKEIYDSLVNKNTRFHTKIFANKSGPVITKVTNKRKACINDVFENPISLLLPTKNNSLTEAGQMMVGGMTPGFSFPNKPGLHGFKNKRAEMREKRKNELQSSFDDDSISNLSRSNSPKERKINGEDYLKQAMERKNSFNEIQSSERQEQRNKYSKLQQENYANIQTDNMNKAIITSEKNSDDIFLTEEEKKEKARQHYYNIIYGKNALHLSHDESKLKHLAQEKHRKMRSARIVGPQSYDIRGNMLNPKKGISMVPKRNMQSNEIFTAPYQRIPSDFDIIVSKQKDCSNSYMPRTDSNVYKDIVNSLDNYNLNKLIEKLENKYEKHEENLKKNDKYLHIQLFLEKVKANEQKHKEINLDHKKRREAYLKHLYKSQTLKEMNYNQVETRAPAYSLKGRYNNESANEDKFSLRRSLGGQYAITEPENEEIYPLPNFNYTKPKAPNCAFGKANRFPTEISETANVGINDDYEDEDDYGYPFGKDSVSFSNKEPL